MIIDGTEIPIKVPKPPAVQQLTFYLLGGYSGWVSNFVSDAYGGSASDRPIIEKRMLTEKLEPGDSVMADKVFNVLNFNVLNV